MNPFAPVELLRIGPLTITESAATSVVISAVILVVGAIVVRSPSTRELAEVVVDDLTQSLRAMVSVDITPVVPLILTQWAFLVVANLVGLLPGLSSPTADLSVTLALALVAFGAGHVFAFRAHGLSYLRHYLEPNPLLLPFNVLGELSRTVALALRLFGNVLSGEVIGSVLIALVGLLVPVPMMLLSVLTSVVQAYIFGILTLVFTTSSMEIAHDRARRDLGRGGS